MPLAPQKCSHMHSSLEQIPSAQIFTPTWVVSEITSLNRCAGLLRMECGLPCVCLEVLSFSLFPPGKGMNHTNTYHNIQRWYLGRVLLQHPMFWIGKACDGVADHQMLACWPLGKCCMLSGVLFTKEIKNVYNFLCQPAGG